MDPYHCSGRFQKQHWKVSKLADNSSISHGRPKNLHQLPSPNTKRNLASIQYAANCNNHYIMFNIPAGRWLTDALICLAVPLGSEGFGQMRCTQHLYIPRLQTGSIYVLNVEYCSCGHAYVTTLTESINANSDCSYRPAEASSGSGASNHPSCPAPNSKRNTGAQWRASATLTSLSSSNSTLSLHVRQPSPLAHQAYFRLTAASSSSSSFARGLSRSLKSMTALPAVKMDGVCGA